MTVRTTDTGRPSASGFGHGSRLDAIRTFLSTPNTHPIDWHWDQSGNSNEG